MQNEKFFSTIRQIFELPPLQRHARLLKFYAEIQEAYLEVIESMDTAAAARPSGIDDDPRNLAQIVGHITEWDRFIMQGLCDVLIGCRHPRLVSDFEGFISRDGERIDFSSVDSFNDYHAEEQAALPWEQLLREAIQITHSLYALVSHPDLLNAPRLEATEAHDLPVPGDPIHTRMGWLLWYYSMEHMAIGHAPELGLPGKS